MSLKILLCGAGGRMGHAITSIAEDHGCSISYPVDIGDDASAGIDFCDVVIDFSLRQATLPLARLSAESGKAMVIGTTGHDLVEKKKLSHLHQKSPWFGPVTSLPGLIYYFT